MTTLFNCTFESGSLYDPPPKGTGAEFACSNGARLECVAAAAHSGSYGLRVTPNSGSTTFGMVSFHHFRANGMKRLRQRFWISPGTLSFTGTGSFRIARNFYHSYNFAAYRINLGYNGSSFYIDHGFVTDVAGNQADDNFGYNSSAHLITNAWHMIELSWYAGSPGAQSLYIDGSLASTLSGTNSKVVMPAPAIGIGYPAASGVTVSGSFYLDDWEANDDGSEIGA